MRIPPSFQRRLESRRARKRTRPPVFPAQAGIQVGAKAPTATRWGGVAWGAFPVCQRRHRHTPPGFQPALERRGQVADRPRGGVVWRGARSPPANVRIGLRPSPRLSSAGWNPGGRQATRWDGVTWGALPIRQRRHRLTPFPPSFQRRLESRGARKAHTATRWGGGGVGRAPHPPTSASAYALSPVFPAQAGIQVADRPRGGAGVAWGAFPIRQRRYRHKPSGFQPALERRGQVAGRPRGGAGVAWGAFPIRQRRHRLTPPGFQPPLERRAGAGMTEVGSPGGWGESQPISS